MAHNETTQRAAIYLRVSTEDQVEKYGLDVQRERTTAQAIAKGWQVVREFIDAGISGTKDEKGRAGLASLLEAAAAGDIDAVVILSLDRLGRKTAIVLEMIEQLTAAGVDVVSCKESLDTQTPQGQFVLTIFAGLAQLERDVIVERTTAGRNMRGKIDGEKGGRVPYGYVRTENGIEIETNTSAVSVVRDIFQYASEGLSLRKIASILNKAGVPTSKGGSRWYASSVREILQNEETYKGGQRGVSPVRWPAIL